jgi:hypothetical protein
MKKFFFDSNSYIGVFTPIPLDYRYIIETSMDNLYFYPLWLEGNNSIQFPLSNNLLLEYKYCLNNFKLDLFNLKNDNLLNKLSFFNEVNNSLFEEINFVFIHDALETKIGNLDNNIMNYILYSKNSKLTVRFIYLTFSSLFEYGMYRDLLTKNNEKKLTLFIFNNEANYFEINLFFNSFRNNNSNIVSNNEIQTLALMSKFYTNNILLHNSFIMDNEFNLNDDVSLMMYTLLLNTYKEI